MIKLTRTSRRALELELDQAGVGLLADAARSVATGARQNVTLEALVDLSIPKRKAPRLVQGTLTLEIGSGTLVATAEGLTWRLEDDEMEYLVERLEDREGQSSFFPAEFTQVRSGRQNDLDMVYFRDTTAD